MSSGPVENWNDLAGRVVQIRKGSRVIRSGHVEAVTPAADVLWLGIHGAEPRALYEKAEGYTVWPLTGQAGPAADL
jgi:hypothetical protein